jgi:DNA-binding NarL/FixJ family response regulator
MRFFKGFLMKLSPQKVKIITLMAKGYTDKEIAIKLKISIRTVQTHVSSIILALKARNRVNAVALYMVANPRWKIV